MISDEAKFVLFSVFDENRSWYLAENIRRFCKDAANVNRKDPQFYASNVMHSEYTSKKKNGPPCEGSCQFLGTH